MSRPLRGRGVNLGGGNGKGVNRGNYGGNSGKGHGGGGHDDRGQKGSNSFVNKSSSGRSQTGNNYYYTYEKSTHYVRNDNPIVKLSRSLSNVLRHNAVKEGLKIQPDGFVNVDELVSNIKFNFYCSSLCL